MRLPLLALLLLLLPALAHARHSVSLDLGVGRAEQPTGSDAASDAEPSYNFSTILGGSIEAVEDRLAIDLGLGLLKDEGSTPSYSGSLGLEFTPDDHWSLSLGGTFSPERSAEYDGTSTLVVRATGETFDGIRTHYSTRDWSTGLNLSGGYDSFGDSNLEFAADASVGWTHYDVSQDVSYPRFPRLTTTLDGTLNQFRLGASATGTFFQDTDVTLRFAWYLYLEDPDKVGYSRLLRPRTALVSGTGLPIAPLRWDLRPSLTHRFAKWIGATLAAGVGGYEDGGTLASGNVKLTVKPTRFLKIAVSFNAQRDIDPPGTASLWSFYGGVGGTWYF